MWHKRKVKLNMYMRIHIIVSVLIVTYHYNN